MTCTPARRDLAVFLAALALFATSVREPGVRVVDLGALRILEGDVPYRDFWTMYAPGSLYDAAGAFAVLGREMIVSNVLGVVAAAAGVAAFHRLASSALAAGPALVPTALFGIAYYSAGYHVGLASYPTGILCALLAAVLLGAWARGAGRGKLAGAGVCLGLSILFKHDVGAYASVACAAALAIGGAPEGASRARSLVVLATAALAVVLPPLCLLGAAGAGPDMLRDLVVFPLTDFPAARKEGFPGLLPEWDGDSAREVVHGVANWGRCNAPLALFVIALPALWRRRASFGPGSRHALLFALVAFPLVWRAAHVQINTHVITFSGLAALLAAAAWLRPEAPRGARWGVAGLVAFAALSLAIEPGRKAIRGLSEDADPLGLPGLSGIRASPEGARRWRDLAAEIAAAGPPEAPLLLVANRNDVLVYALGVPYWLSPRRPVTRHHELHPAVTDTEEVQRRMLDDVGRGPLPVLVREHRFDDATLDRAKAMFQGFGLRIGATELDRWVASRYREGPRFGMYEVMRAR